MIHSFSQFWRFFFNIRSWYGNKFYLSPFQVLQRYLAGGLCGFDKEGSPIKVELFGRLDMKGIVSSAKNSDLEKTKLLQCEKTIRLWKEQSKKVQCLWIDNVRSYHLFFLIRKIMLMLSDSFYNETCLHIPSLTKCGQYMEFHNHIADMLNNNWYFCYYWILIIE